MAANMTHSEHDWRVPLRRLYDLRVWRKPEGCTCPFPDYQLGVSVKVSDVELDIGCPWHGIVAENPFAMLPPMVLGEAR